MNLKKGEISYVNRLIDDFKEKERYSSNYLEIYIDDYDKKLAMVFSSFHNWLNDMFNYMNTRIETGHFHADPSREAIELFRKLGGVLGVLSKHKIELSQNYGDLIKTIKRFISSSGGSTVPEDFEEIKIEEVNPIFESKKEVLIKKDKKFKLQPIGKGSYAQVFKYYDEDYEREFVLKKALSNLDSKELKRFRREFDTMKSLRSPYIVEVYKYDEVDNSYSMELLDSTLYEYLKKNNQHLTLKDRCYIINQIIRGFKHLINNEVLHRDISPKNILINDYGDIKVVKISDFGLVKIKESQLTAPDTEFKGSLNDPNLIIEGFKSYSEAHEMYALTYLISIIISGKFNISKVTNGAIKKFINIGMAGIVEERFQTTNELFEGYLNMKKELEKTQV